MLQNKLYMECIEIDIETLMVKEARTANRRLAKKRVQCLNEALCFVSSSVLADSLVLRNPLLRQAPKRYATFKMDNKQLKDLTADDLIGKPIWEFWISDNIEYVREAFDNEITEDSHVSYIVLTEFIFNNKTKHIGFCSPQDSSGLDYIQPVVFADTEQVNFYINNGLTKNEKNELMSKLGYTWKDIFPIVYSTKIKCNGEYYNGLITDFNEGR